MGRDWPLMPTIRKKPNEIRVANHSASFSTCLAPPIQNMWLSTLVKADAVEEVREARVAAHWIKERMHFDVQQNR